MLLKLSTIIFFYDGTFLYISSIIKQLTIMKKFTISAKVFQESQELLETISYLREAFPTFGNASLHAYLKDNSMNNELENKDKLKIALVFEKFFYDKTEKQEEIEKRDSKLQGFNYGDLDELQRNLLEHYSMTADQIAECLEAMDYELNLQALVIADVLVEIKCVFLSSRETYLLNAALKTHLKGVGELSSEFSVGSTQELHNLIEKIK